MKRGSITTDSSMRKKEEREEQDFIQRSDEFRDRLLAGTSYDQTLGWAFLEGIAEAYSHLGNDGFVNEASTEEGEKALFRKQNKCVDITFRGSVLPEQWFSKAGNCVLEKKPAGIWAPGCEGLVFGGLGEAYNNLRPALLNIYEGLGVDCERVRVMGHSRGAALAQLAALDISCNFFEGPIDAVICAGPRVGDAEFKRFYHSRKNIQLVNFELASDPVPKFPPAKLDDSIMSTLMGLLPRAAKEAIETGFDHIVTPICLDENWAEPVAIEVVASIIAGEPTAIHAMTTYKTAYKRFFMDPVELGRDHPPALVDAFRKRVLATFLATTQDPTLQARWHIHRCMSRVQDWWAEQTLDDLHFSNQSGVNILAVCGLEADLGAEELFYPACDTLLKKEGRIFASSLDIKQIIADLPHQRSLHGVSQRPALF